MTCGKNTDTDIDKVMVSLNPEKKEFFVDPPTLQVRIPTLFSKYICFKFPQMYIEIISIYQGVKNHFFMAQSHFTSSIWPKLDLTEHLLQ